MSKPIPVKDVVEKVVHALEVSDSGVSKQDIARALNTLVDVKTSQHIKAERYEKDRLVINVSSSVWLYMLNRKKRGLQARLNTALPGLHLKQLVFKVGNI